MKGAVGGERGFEAGGLCIGFARGTVSVLEGEIKKIMNPSDSRPARMSVIGLVRRNDRGIAIVRGTQPSQIRNRNNNGNVVRS